MTDYNKDATLCVPLEWDSKFFGMRIARIVGNSINEQDVTLIDNWCNSNHIDCLYFLARADSILVTRLAENSGFSFVDIRVTLLKNGTELGESHVVDSNITIRHWVTGDISSLSEIAGQSHRDSRFYYDEHFSRERCNSLYRTWLVRSCEGYADAVLVAVQNGATAGYVTCHKDVENYQGRVGLLGVSEEYRGIGLGHALVVDALNWFGSQGIRQVIVRTQGRNIGAQRFYQQHGFRTSSVQLWYHKWFSRGNN